MRGMIIFSLSLFAIMFFSGWLGAVIGKRLFFKMSVHVMGWRRKNRFVVNDERLLPALWKMHIWGRWTLLSATITLTCTGLAIYRNDFLFLAGAIVGGTVATAVSVIFWRERIAQFNALKERLGVVLERDEKAVKAARAQGMKQIRPFWIVVTALFFVLSMLHFWINNTLFGILWGAIAVGYVVLILYYRAKEKRIKQDGDSKE